jgi:integrase
MRFETNSLWLDRASGSFRVGERAVNPISPLRGFGVSTLRKAKVAYFRIYDLRSTYATRLSAGGVADEWVIQLLRQGNSDVFKKYSQMKLAMKREALEKLNRRANEMSLGEAQTAPVHGGFGTVLVQ